MRRIHALKLLLPLLGCCLIIACSSRYKYDLYQTADEIRRKVKVEETKFIPNAILGKPENLEKFVPGTGNVLVITTGTRGLTHETDAYSVVRFDEYLRCEIYVQLTSPLVAGTVPLTDNAFLIVRGRYDQPAASKIFRPESGELVVDSLKGSRLFTTVNGVFRNAEQARLSFDGNVKVKYR